MKNGNKAFIPTRLNVGFQDRADTLQKRLGYVTYFDEKGVMRKNESWERWRKKDIEPEQYDNVPTAGFLINKGITRTGFYWGGKTVKMRVYDPRGFEVEITMDNLAGIISHSVIDNGEIKQECVYVWFGSELFLIPTNSEVYQKAAVNTAKQNVKITKNELIIGGVYSLKKSSDTVTYVGHLSYGDLSGYNSYCFDTGKLATNQEINDLHNFNSRDEIIRRIDIEIQQRSGYLNTENEEIQRVQNEYIAKLNIRKEELLSLQYRDIRTLRRITFDKKHVFLKGDSFITLDLSRLSGILYEVEQDVIDANLAKYQNSEHYAPIAEIGREYFSKDEMLEILKKNSHHKIFCFEKDENIYSFSVYHNRFDSVYIVNFGSDTELVVRSCGGQNFVEKRAGKGNRDPNINLNDMPDNQQVFRLVFVLSNGKRVPITTFH